MSLKRLYDPKTINWILVPQLIEETEKLIQSQFGNQFAGLTAPMLVYTVDTVSQHADLPTRDEFLSFLKNLTEPPSSVRASICYPGMMITGPGFESFYLLSHVDGIEIEIQSSYKPEYLELLDKYEDVLDLTPYKPTLSSNQPRIRRRTAFVAHAFDEIGDRHALRLTQFLSLLGFEIASGKGFSPEQVKEKVRRRLHSQEIVMVIMSAKEDLTWLVQEAAGADFSKKPVFAHSSRRRAQSRDVRRAGVYYFSYGSHFRSLCSRFRGTQRTWLHLRVSLTNR